MTALVVLSARHASFAQGRGWNWLDVALVTGVGLAAVLLRRRPPRTVPACMLWFGVAVAAAAGLVAATGGATSPYSLLFDLIAIVAATTLTRTAFGSVIGLIAVACLLPFVYVRPVPHEFMVATSVGAPLLVLMSLFTRALFGREQAMTRLAEERAAMLASSFDATLLALGSALDVRDTETEGHARRVAHNTRLIGERLGVAADELVRIERGAFLHDIGKIGVPDAVLRKPGPLDDQEWQLMRRHAAIGAEIVEKVPFLRPAAVLIAAHHERWDGHGYPAGLAGDAIPLGARMFAVADAYDAMTSDRPYRRALPPEVALAELRRGAGTQFDPRVVAIALQLAAHGALIDGPSSAGRGGGAPAAPAYVTA